jgi:GT2 family glycosyltransferase
MSSSPQCSVIIISFNHYAETTGPCLQSLLADTTELEIIVVDNHSDKTTREELHRAAERDPRIRLVLNRENSGYAAANNIGAQHATSPLLLLLNSDTELLPDSISCLIRLMTEHPDWAMLGPISNQTGNDQQIHTTGQTADTILAEGNEWCCHSSGFHYATDILSFCCVMIRKNVYSQLNGLDEAFGLGYYEDTDFNYRAVNSGLQLMITEDAFIYHRGSGSFSKTSREVYKMVKRNKQLFRQKHGHGILAAHWRIKNLEALKRYADASPEEYAVADLRYKFRNRLTLAEKLIPNSPIKKFFYYSGIRKVKNQFIAKFNHY